MRHFTGYKQKLKSEKTLEEKIAIKQWLSLRKLTPKQWHQRIKAKVPKELVPVVARVVWWDFWSERMVSERWSEFDQYLPGCSVDGEVTPFTDDTTPSESLWEPLLAIGYPEYRVKLRLMAF